MTKKNRVATIVAACIVIAAGVTGSVYAAVTVSHDKEEAESSTVVTTQAETSTEAPTEAVTAATTEVVTTDAPATTTTTAPVTRPEETTVSPEEITFEYDPQLSRQIAEMIVQKYPNMQYTPNGELTAYPDNLVKDGKVGTANNHFIFSDACDSAAPAETIISKWMRIKPDYIYQGKYSFDIEAYRFSNGYFYVEFH